MKGESTRDHLIAVGLELFHKHGYEATGLAEILEAAGVPKGSFYHYFRTKDDFALAVLERYSSREAERCAEILSDSKLAPLERLRKYFVQLKKVFGQKGAVPGCLMTRFSLEIAAVCEPMQVQLSRNFGAWEEAVAQVLELAVEEKALPAETNAKSLAGFLLNSWQGALVRSIAEKNNKPLDQFLHYCFEQLLTGE